GGVFAREGTRAGQGRDRDIGRRYVDVDLAVRRVVGDGKLRRGGIELLQLEINAGFLFEDSGARAADIAGGVGFSGMGIDILLGRGLQGRRGVGRKRERAWQSAAGQGEAFAARQI